MSGEESEEKQSFPLDLWLNVMDLLEEDDDRKTLAALARCNKNFLGVARTRLYRRFIVKNGARSLALFFRTLLQQPLLASYVREVNIHDFLDLPAEEMVALVGVALPSKMIVESVISFCSGLTSVYLDHSLKFFDGEPNSTYGDFLGVLNTLKVTAGLRLAHLKEVTLEISENFQGLHDIPIKGLLNGVAPGIERLTIRRRSYDLEDDEEGRYREWELWEVDPPERPYSNLPAGVLHTLENLRELTLDCNHLGQWPQYVLAQHCKGLKTLTFTRGNTDEMRLDEKENPEEALWSLDFLITGGRRYNITQHVDFSLKSLESLETLAISQDAILYGKLQNGIKKDRLDDFFPLSLRTLRIEDFTHDLKDDIHRYASMINEKKRQGYAYLEVVELTLDARKREWIQRKLSLTEDEKNVIVALFTAADVKCTFKEGCPPPEYEGDEYYD
ncbi:hypothetical protein GGR53DRAFT_474506 [Hypoxylon sp. FL1150]|nr:hypothetical protein GGR53DRAFT_474506 [Hypoxylon sp. FL1150]